jgi:hypothetical protein
MVITVVYLFVSFDQGHQLFESISFGGDGSGIE